MPLSDGFKTIYQRTKKGGFGFDVLLDRVASVNPEMRIRFTAPHPKDFPDSILQVINEHENICKCIHLPAQSGSDSVLERMRRGYTKEAYLKLVEKMKAVIPNVAFTSDFICGYCGESEEDHQETLDLIRKVKYSFIFVYPYSMREVLMYI